MYRWLRNIFLAVLVVVTTMAIVAVCGAEDAGPGSRALLVELLLLFLVGAPLVAKAFMILIGEAGISEPRRRAWLVLSYLEQAVRMNLPLPRMLRAAEATERGLTGQQLKKLRLKLEAGHSITASVHEAIPLIPTRAVALLAASEKSGRVGEELTRVLDDRSTRTIGDAADESFIQSYPLIMTLAIVCIVSIVMIFVIPKFKQIFQDFGVPLPWLTTAMINTANAIIPGGWILLPIIAIPALFLLRKTRWFQRLQLLAGLPIYRNLADICHVIADALGAGMPLNLAIRLASGLSVGRSLRRKLARWSDGVEGGMPSAIAADAAGMPRLISAMTATADLTSTAEAFRFLAGYYALKFSRFMTLIRAATIPAITFFFGIVVCLVVLALFLPLIDLIDTVNPYRGLP